MNIYAFASAASAILSLALGFIVITLNPRSRLNRFFLVFCLSLTYIGFIEFGYRQAESLDAAMFWLKLSALSPIVVSLFLNFAIVFTDRQKRWRNPLIYIVVYLPAIIFIIADMSSHWITGDPVRTPWGWGYSISRTIWYLLYSIWFSSLLLLLAVLCFIYYVHETDAQKRRQAKFIAIGFVVPVVLGFCTEVVFPYTNIRFPELNTLGFAIANIFIAYAMWRYKLFILSPATAADRIIDTMSDSLFLIDRNGLIQFVNNAAGALLRCDPGTLPGQEIAAQFDNHKAIRELLNPLDSRVDTVHDITATIRTKMVPVSLSASVMRDNKGMVQGVVLLCRDVTERIKAQEALQKARDELEERVITRTAELANTNVQLAEEKECLAVTLISIADGVITTDVQGNVVMLNRMAETLTGWSAQEAAGRPVKEIFHLVRTVDRAKALDPVQEVIQSGATVELTNDALLIARDGAERRIVDSAAPIKHFSGDIIGVVIVFRDITEKERLEEELFRMKKLESVGILAGGIAHDFNNLLTGIITNLFLTKITIPDNREAYALINEAESAVQRAQRLTTQLLTFAKGGDPLKQVASVKTLIEDCIGFLFSGSPIEYELQLADDLMQVDMDKGQIDQVISNLVLNAQQAMPNGGTITISACNITLGIDGVKNESPQPALKNLAPGFYVKVSVSDEGVGIPFELREKIFDPFFTTKEGGKGLGLSIVYSIIKKHSGCITVDSMEGKGTTFSFYLPAVRFAGNKNNADHRTNQGEIQSSGKGLILLMDDEQTILKSTGMILRHLGYDVVTTANGEDAIALFRQSYSSDKPVDAAILDLTVPGGMGGKECIRHLKRIDPDVLAIVSSGFSNDPVMARYREYGFAGVLSKPYSVSSLADAVRIVLQDRYRPGPDEEGFYRK